MSKKNLNKLQIRAELLNTITRLDVADKHSANVLQEIINPLYEIEDKNTILDILLKETISNSNENRFLIISYLIEKLIPKDMIESQLWALLSQSEIDDTAKAHMIRILQDLGNKINYEKYVEYFENPDKVLDADTEKLLKSALANPEALIDFLDFIEALPEKDRNLLVDSLCEDYKGDELANLFVPVVYANPNSDLCLYAIQKLGESKSAFAIRPLEWIISYTENSEVVKQAKKSLNQLKIAGARVDNTDEFYLKLFENTELDDVYVSLPDGRGNVAMLFSRKKKDKDSVQMFAVVTNDIIGIIDCFGFNELSSNELNRIIDKFYSHQEKIWIPSGVAKSLLLNGEKLALATRGKMSYEYVCWRTILNDVKPIDGDLNQYLAQKLEKLDINQDTLKKLYSTAIFDKWFINICENENFDFFLEEVVKVINDKDDVLAEIEKQIIAHFSLIWNIKTIKLQDERLLLTAYILYLQGHHSYANLVYSIIYNSEVKQELLKNIIKNSIYEFLLTENEKHNEEKATNIFTKRNEANKSLMDRKKMQRAISVIEESWGV